MIIETAQGETKRILWGTRASYVHTGRGERVWSEGARKLGSRCPRLFWFVVPLGNNVRMPARPTPDCSIPPVPLEITWGCTRTWF